MKKILKGLFKGSLGALGILVAVLIGIVVISVAYVTIFEVVPNYFVARSLANNYISENLSEEEYSIDHIESSIFDLRQFVSVSHTVYITSNKSSDKNFEIIVIGGKITANTYKNIGSGFNTKERLENEYWHLINHNIGWIGDGEYQTNYRTEFDLEIEEKNDKYYLADGTPLSPDGDYDLNTIASEYGDIIIHLRYVWSSSEPDFKAMEVAISHLEKVIFEKGIPFKSLKIKVIIWANVFTLYYDQEELNKRKALTYEDVHRIYGRMNDLTMVYKEKVKKALGEGYEVKADLGLSSYKDGMFIDKYENKIDPMSANWYDLSMRSGFIKVEPKESPKNKYTPGWEKEMIDYYKEIRKKLVAHKVPVKEFRLNYLGYLEDNLFVENPLVYDEEKEIEDLKKLLK